MLRKVSFVVVALACVSDAKRLPRDNLLVYRSNEGKIAPVETADDWQQRRVEIVRGMEAVMGKLPGNEKRCPLEMKVEEEFEGDTYVRRLITYTSEPGGRTPAYLLIPKDVLAGKRKAPAVLCLHGTDMVIGHGTVVGMKKNRGYALELAERGYVTLAPNYPIMAKYQPDIKKLGWESGTLKAVWDNIRGLDLLESLPFVDKSRGFATIGHSLGGHNSVYTAVFDPRLKVVVSSCGLDSYVDYMNGDPKRWLPEKGWAQTRYMAKMADYRGRLADIPFDFHEMIGTLAPRHVLIIAPTKDSNFRADSVDRIVAAAKPVFKLLGHEDRLRVIHPECEHDFPPDMRELAYKTIDEVLKATPSARNDLVQTPLFVSGKGDYHTYRIPALIVTKKGSLLAFCEGRKNSTSDTGAIHLLMRRSVDGGQTWSESAIVWEDGDNTCGNPCPVVDRDTGTIWLLLTHNLGIDTQRQIETRTAKGSRTAWVCHSDDDGITWSKPLDITKDVKKPDWTWYATGPGVGVQTKDGRLVVPCDHYLAGSRAQYSHVIYSDDHGKSWKLGGAFGPKCNECQVIERTDGSLLLNMRSYRGKNRRALATSSDGGITWTPAGDDDTLIEPVCQASIVRQGAATVFANPASKKRERMTVRLSHDDGKSWPISRVLHEGPAAYSCLAVLPKGTIACLYERGDKSAYQTITLARFSLGWLTGQ